MSSSQSLLAGQSLAADHDASLLAASFCLHARAEPAVMPRVLELFAKRGLVPHKWHSTVSDAMLTIDVLIAGIDRDLVDYIARCMRQIVGVDAVLTSDTHLSL